MLYSGIIHPAIPVAQIRIPLELALSGNMHQTSVDMATYIQMIIEIKIINTDSMIWILVILGMFIIIINTINKSKENGVNMD